MTEEEELAAQFEVQRPYLHGVAFRALGSHAEADDAVQEAWLRLARTDAGSIEDLRGWLTTVTGRILPGRSAQAGEWGEQPLELHVGMPGWDTAADSGINPEAQALLADSVGLALYVLTDALPPAERVSFVLHDIFDIPFDTIAAILGRSTPAAKMLASRARARLRLGTPPAGTHAAARDVINAFLAAAGTGDIATLLTVLAPDAELGAHGTHGTVVIRGAGQIAAAGDQVRASERAGTPGTRGWHPGRSRYRRGTTGHGHGLHGHRRYRHRDPRPDRTNPTGPGRPLVGRLTGCRLRRTRPTFQLRAGGSCHSADDQRDVVVLIRSAEFLDFC